IFGCIAYAHVPDAYRKKLDNKSIKCVHLGISDESKAYRLYNPVDKKIVISRDVVFDESKSWDWDNKEKKVNAGNDILIEENEEDTPVNNNNANDTTASETEDMEVGYDSTDVEDEPTDEEHLSNNEEEEELGQRPKRLPVQMKIHTPVMRPAKIKFGKMQWIVKFKD
ncbi:copia-type polyprotein, partial [Trifolium medium]|nr:copia-type polyprotein [Trifolium medium]